MNPNNTAAHNRRRVAERAAAARQRKGRFWRGVQRVFGADKHIRIGIAGLTASGKSTYVVTALETLRGRPVKISDCPDDAKQLRTESLPGLLKTYVTYAEPDDRYTADVASAFDHDMPQKINSTQTGATHERKLILGHGGRECEVVICDTAGGDFANERLDEAGFYDCDAFIITVDPLRMGSFYNLLIEHGRTREQVLEEFGVAYEAAQKSTADALRPFFERANRRKPLAIVLTKLDLMRTVLRENPQLVPKRPIAKPKAEGTQIERQGFCVTDNAVDIGLIEEAGEEVKQMLRNAHEDNLLNLAEARTGKCMFFAVSGHGIALTREYAADEEKVELIEHRTPGRIYTPQEMEMHARRRSDPTEIFPALIPYGTHAPDRVTVEEIKTTISVRKKKINPHRVTDPLLWLLSTQGFLPTSGGRTTK